MRWNERGDCGRGAGRRSRAGTVAILLSVVLLTAAALLAVACGDEGTSSPSPTTASASPPLPGYPATPPAGAETLTAEEEAWLEEKGTLKVGAFSDYPPFSSVPSGGGEATGIAVDYWKLKRIGWAWGST